MSVHPMGANVRAALSDQQPIPAILIGGEPGYGVVRQLSMNLRKQFDIMVIRHFDASQSSVTLPTSTALVIVLTDLCGHPLLDAVNATVRRLPEADRPAVVRTTRRWATLQKHLHDLGFQLVENQSDADDLLAEAEEDPPVASAPAATPAPDSAAPPVDGMVYGIHVDVIIETLEETRGWIQQQLARIQVQSGERLADVHSKIRKLDPQDPGYLAKLQGLTAQVATLTQPREDGQKAADGLSRILRAFGWDL